MPWIHPPLMLATLFLAFYALVLGFIRFRVRHLGKKGLVFPWKRHVVLGSSTIALWFAGAGGGLFVTWWYWNSPSFSGLHAMVAAIMVPLMGLGYGTGYIMNRFPGKRRRLPVAHALVNTVLVLLALFQVGTGLSLVQTLLFSR